MNRRSFLDGKGIVKPPAFPRPPGAIEEADFKRLCTLCMDCAVACPHSAIGVLPDGSPALNPNRAPCHLCEDLPCVAACEPKALTPLRVEHVFFGLAAINGSTCLPFRGPECGACKAACPTHAIHLESLRPVIDLDRCNGCGLCRDACVVHDPSIRISW